MCGDNSGSLSWRPRLDLLSLFVVSAWVLGLITTANCIQSISIFLEKLFYDYHIDHCCHSSCFFFFQISFMHRNYYYFFSTLNYLWMTLKGGINQIKTPTENKKNNKKKQIWRDFFYWNVKLLTYFGTKVWSSCRHSFPNWQKSLTSPVFVVFKLVSSNYLKPKPESSSMMSETRFFSSG